MKEFRKKIIHAFAWNSISVFLRQGLTLLIHIILARILVPEDYGIIGMISIFMDLSLRLQGAGLGESLIRKKETTQAEYNFVFYYGLLIGLLCYLTLYYMAPLIANFYKEPRLVWIIRIMTLNLILIPLRGMNRVQLVKELRFDKIAKVEIIASIGSGLIAILFAYMGFGVWSLVIQNLSMHLFSTTMFLKFNWWLPSLSLNKNQSKALFSFGSKLMIANFIEVGFKNIYNVIIGKQYSATMLGFYSQGLKLQRLPSNAINSIIKSVSFPVFANIKEDKKKYKEAFKKTMRLLTFLNFPILITLASIADPLIPLLLSPKWIKTIPFFQMLVVIGLLGPIKSLFINILKVEGNGGKLIQYSIFTKIFYLVGVLITFKLNIYALIISQIIATILELSVFSTIGKTIGYNLTEFIQDILPNLFIATSVGGILILCNKFIQLSDFSTLLMDIALSGTLIIILSYLTKNPSFMEIKNEIIRQYQ